MQEPSSCQGGVLEQHAPEMNDSEDADDQLKDVLDIRCALTSDSGMLDKMDIVQKRSNYYPQSALKLSDGMRMGGARVSVQFNEALNTHHEVTAYSCMCGRLPQTHVATRIGWK